MSKQNQNQSGNMSANSTGANNLKFLSHLKLAEISFKGSDFSSSQDGSNAIDISNNPSFRNEAI
jgi:hypothetical protein